MDKRAARGNTAMLLLGLLAQQEMYGYQMIETLAQRSDNVFALKAGTLYPLLHDLEAQGCITAWERQAEGRTRRYYGITDTGRARLAEMQAEWEDFSGAVNRVLKGGVGLAAT